MQLQVHWCLHSLAVQGVICAAHAVMCASQTEQSTLKTGKDPYIVPLCLTCGLARPDHYCSANLCCVVLCHVGLCCTDADVEGFSRQLQQPIPFAAVDSIVRDEQGQLKFHYVVVEVSPPGSCRPAACKSVPAATAAACNLSLYGSRLIMLLQAHQLSVLAIINEGLHCCCSCVLTTNGSFSIVFLCF